MSKPEYINIQAKNINEAATEIIDVLEDTSNGNVICFSGWSGFGASTALKVVAQRLKSSKSKFDKVIHVDCTVWKSMRALQKAVAEELELPQSVMAIFGQCDEEDDFNGIEEGSRGVIEDVGRRIYENLADSGFVVIFHNGSSRYIDMYECGVPAIPFLRNKVLWTWHGRLRLRPMIDDGEREKMMQSNNFFGCSLEDYELRDLVREEVEEIANCASIAELDYMNHTVVKQCVLYGWLIRRIISPTVVDLDTHALNYWICDGIIQGQGNTSAWEIGHSLKRNMHLDWFLKETKSSSIPMDWNRLMRFDFFRRYDMYNYQRESDLYFISSKAGKIDYTANHLETLLPDVDVRAGRWNFTTHKRLLKDNTRVLPPRVTSFFLSADEPPTNTISILPVGMFQHSQSSKLRVLYLSHSTFSFASPPFVHCAHLRLLHLDHCTNITDEEHPSYKENMSCFQKLWVLNLRYTNWYWLLSEKMKRVMVELRELNVEGLKHGRISDLCGGRPSLVILRVIEDQAQFSNMSSTNSLMTSSFINDILPPRLESFSFINKVANAANISSISFRGCSRLKSILIRGNLRSPMELDLSGTAVKTLDLREVEVSNLRRVILLGCEKLCAILWPPRIRTISFCDVLHINTIRHALPSQANSREKTDEASSTTRPSSILPIAVTQPDIFSRTWYIAVRDARLLWSLEPVKETFPSGSIHMEMNSSPASKVAVCGSEVAQRIIGIQQPDHYSYARDIVFQDHLQDGAGNEGTISWIWACPPRPTLRYDDWYVHVQDEQEMKRGLLQQEQSSIEGTSKSATIPPSFMCDQACMLHVHDSSSITSIPWPKDPVRYSFKKSSLKWCRVERCPNLCFVFATLPKSDGWTIFRHLSTFWASQLPKACYIWNWNTLSHADENSFWYLSFLHLDCCPRLIHVLPLSMYMDALPSLETLEIVDCGDLKEVFPLDPRRQEKQETIKFPNLRRIHLYQLSNLQSISGSRMSAPNLETVKIRGCWGLRRLPAVSGSTTKRPKVDCEKDWWDNLEWEGLGAKHDPSLYEPCHSRYYKNAHLPRVSVLR